MRRVTLTGSGLWRASRCIASAVLPRASSTNVWAERGKAIHKFLLEVNRIGRDKALDQIEDEKFRAACALIRTERLPVDPGAYAAEVALAYDVVTGRARELHRKGDRDYSMCTATEIPMTLDVVGLVGSEAVKVVDYKSGYKYIEPPAVNWQFRIGGLAAARVWGRNVALVDMIRLGADGEPFSTSGELDLFGLSEVAEEARELHADATRAAAADVEPPITIGSHCEGCASISVCGSTALIRRDPNDLTKLAGELTPEMALDAWEWLSGQEAALAAAWKVLETYAKFNPIRLRDGRVFGPIEKHRDYLDGRKVWHALAQLVGSDEAWKVTKIAATKKDLEELAARLAQKLEDFQPTEALTSLVQRTLARSKRNGSKLYKTPLLKRLLEDLEESGALKTSSWEAVEAYKPKELKE